MNEVSVLAGETGIFVVIGSASSLFDNQRTLFLVHNFYYFKYLDQKDGHRQQNSFSGIA
jgi:hypothetical protein